MDINLALVQLSEDVRSHWCTGSSVHKLASPPDPATFSREYVSRSKPVVICGAIDDWPALHKWTLQYLAENCSKPVSVNVTPDGWGDAVKPVVEADGARLFVMPEERTMAFAEFAKALTHPESFDGVPYLSRQNDSLREEFEGVCEDVPSLKTSASSTEAGLGFAVAAFGGVGAEAVNLWVGDSRSVSSCHQDFYENIYCVLRGTKRFTLFPPSDCAFLREKPFRSAKHEYTDTGAGDFSDSRCKGSSSVKERGVDACAGVGSEECRGDTDKGGRVGKRWAVEIEGGEDVVNWVDHDVIKGIKGINSAVDRGGGGGCFSEHKGQRGSEAAVQLSTPLVVEVSAGEVLYLPAMWYHQVEQREITVAVNFWHDMNFEGPVFPLLSFVRNLTVPPPTAAAARARESDEKQAGPPRPAATTTARGPPAAPVPDR